MSESDAARGPRFHNITLYVEPGQVERTAAFYREVLGLQSVFEESGHIACFALIGFDVALCIHEAEGIHTAGTTELGFWTDDHEALAERGATAGLDVAQLTYADGHSDPVVTDAAGTRVRLSAPPT